MIEIKVTISDKVLKLLKNALVASHITGRGLSANEKAMGYLLDRIAEGKSEATLVLKKERSNYECTQFI